MLIFIASGPLLWAAGTNDAPVHPAAAPPAGEDFGQYLADHQEDLEPFFQTHSDALVKGAVPLVVALFINVVLINIVFGWLFNAGISFGFAKLFAPAYAQIKRAILYATGHLVLSGIVTILAGLIGLGVAATHSTALWLVAGIILLLLDFVVQTYWVITMYRTRPIVSALFYLSLVGVHAAAVALVSGSVAQAGVKTMVTQFIDQTVTAQLKDATGEIQPTQTAITSARDKLKDEVNTAQDEIDQGGTQEKTLRDSIEAKKSSEVFVYGRIVRMHAEGDLPGAEQQLVAFLAKFPSGSRTDAAKAQLASIESEMAGAEAQKKQAETDALAAVAKARADLLARAAQGEVSLSEMRQALIGKKRSEVSDLFGKPDETSSDRWGYSRQMLVNPMTEEKRGLTVYFADGVVQSVDYYYGGTEK